MPALIANNSVKTANPAAKNHNLRPFIPAKIANPTDAAIHKRNAPGEYDHQKIQRGTKLSFSYGSEIAIKQTIDIMALIMPSAIGSLAAGVLLRMVDIESLYAHSASSMLPSVRSPKLLALAEIA